MDQSALTSQLSQIAGANLASWTLAEKTTIGVGGAPKLAVEVTNEGALIQVLDELRAADVPLLFLGGGSNLLCNDGELPVAVVKACFGDISFEAGGRTIIDAGMVWDDAVQQAVQRGFGGIECLSGIPGCAGAVPVQNVGAYGVEISQVLTAVKLYDLATGEVAWHPADSLDLRYRYSNLKHTKRAIVLQLELKLDPSGLSAPIRFGELANRLGAVDVEQFAADKVREVVLELRANKGMVYQRDDADTHSCGSFFTNPIVAESELPAIIMKVSAHVPLEEAATMPTYPTEGGVKLSAAWLIQHAGFDKGYPGSGTATLSTKHTLALTNRGGAQAADVMALAQEIVAGVQEKFGVTLVPEPVLVGF